jgi:hypothetical protein
MVSGHQHDHTNRPHLVAHSGRDKVRPTSRTRPETSVAEGGAASGKYGIAVEVKHQ